MALQYVLVTPAHNEADYIEATIRAVIGQKVRPKRWVIVNDGSTDSTGDVVKRYLPGNDWMELVSLPPRETRDFVGKVYAIRAGYERIVDTSFDVIGIVDADITFDDDYFEYLLSQFENDETLGVAGTHYVEGDFHSFENSYMNIHHVNGGCQMFRRPCYEDIGGYLPIKGGGVDWVAVTTARMKGWKTYSFSERLFHHHRKIGTANTSEIGARFHYGKKDYFLGGHPIWQLSRSVFQMTKKPYVLGGLALLFGYLACWIRRVERPISNELVQFYRREQMTRLRQMLAGKSAETRGHSD